jgi:integrase
MAMKMPRPFYRKQKEVWVVQLRNGRQVTLGKTKEEAEQKYREVMLHEEGPEKEYLVREVFDLYLDYCQRETGSYDLYLYFLNDAAKCFGHVTASDLKPFHIDRWLRGHPRWGATTRNMVVTVVKAAFNYGVRMGHVPANPVKLMPLPKPVVRDRILTEEERTQIFEAIRDVCFADYLTALLESGARPGEVATLTPENVNLDLGIWVLKKHKTKRKTGRPRVVYLTPALLELTRRRVADTPPGKPVFRNTRGNAWTNSSLYFRFEGLRKRFPHLADVVPYTLRATYATEALEQGVPDATVAELLGHSDTRMLHKHYSKLSKKVEHLRQAAERARASS